MQLDSALMTVGAFETDTGTVYITTRVCEITGDAIIEFGRNYLLRMRSDELHRLNNLLQRLESSVSEREFDAN